MKKAMGISILCMVFLIGVLLSGALAAALNTNPANAGQQGISLQQGKQGNPMLKPLQQPLFADPTAMFPLCSTLRQAADDVVRSIHHLWAGLNCCRSDFTDLYDIYNSYVDQCCSSNKSFSVQEQQAAGCLNSDTVKQCMDKLNMACINNYAEKSSLKNKLDHDLKRTESISIKMKELSEQMKKLRSLIP